MSIRDLTLVGLLGFVLLINVSSPYIFSGWSDSDVHRCIFFSADDQHITQFFESSAEEALI